MTSPPATCTSCGKPLRAGRQQGLCAACLTKGWQQAKAETAREEVGSDVPRLFEIPGHDILNEIARGGMGIVYRAMQHTPRRELAVKMLLPQVATEALRERFRMEARVMASLTHTRILPLYHYGEHASVPWFSMALCKESLAQRRAQYHEHWRDIAELIAQLADAVAFAHAHGVLHRDIKPGNVLFDNEDRAFLSDFGLAKLVSEDSQLTRSISVVGTPHYLAPEVIKASANASTASDLYALGAVLYELLAGHPVFDGGSVAAVLRLIAEEEPAALPTNVPRDLATIALKCLSKDPARRYDSASALGDDLRRWLNNEPVLARRLSSGERFVLWCRRKPALAAMSATLVLTLCTGAVMIVAKNRELRNTLRASLINQARSTRTAAQVQGRFAALEAVRQAAAMGSSPELEEEAASLLALASMRRIADLPADTEHWKLIPDEDLHLAADFRDASVTRIVELPSLKELARLPGGEPIWGGQHTFTSDGRLLAYDESKDLRTMVRDWRTGEIIVGPLSPRRLSPRFSPDGKKFAAGLADGRIEIFDLTQPQSPPTIWPAGNSVPAYPAEFSPNGQWLAARSNTSQVEIHDAHTGRVVTSFGDKSDGQTLSASWFGDSQGMLLGSKNGRVRSWVLNVPSSRLLPQHAAQVYSVAVHPQGQIALSSGYDSRTSILDWTSGRPLGMEPGNSFMTRFSRDGSRAAIHELGEARLRLYEVEVSDVCHQFTLPAALGGSRPPKGSWCAEVSPDGRLLASASYGETTLYDVSSSRYLGTLKDGEGNTLAWAKAGRELWIGAGAKLVRYQFDAREDGSIEVRRLNELPLQGRGSMRLSLAEKADHWAISTLTGFCHGSMSKGDVQFVPAPPEMPASMQFNPLTISPDGRWVAVSAEYSPKLGIYDLHQSRWVAFFEPNQISYTWFSPDSRKMWLGTWTGHWVIDTATWKRTQTVQDRKEPGSLGFTRGTADGRLLATADGMSIVLRHGDSGEPFLWLRHPVAMAAAWMSLTPDGRFLTFSGLGHIQQVWDLARLEREMLALGVAWRGPSPPAATTSRPVTSLVITSPSP